MGHTFVVKKLLSGLRSVLSVRRLDNRIHRTRLLAEAAVYALRHVDIIPCRAAGAVSAFFGFDCDGLSRADLGLVSTRR